MEKKRDAFMKDYDERDYPEDVLYENWNYWNRCSECGETFIGHKRRTVCKLCGKKATTQGGSMNGRIDACGSLFITRGGEEKPQKCPSTKDGFERICGDECPLFGEPEPDEEYFDEGGYKPNGKTVLSLCHQTLTFDVLVDERGK